MSTNSIPEFITRDPEKIMDECKATLKKYLGREEIEPTQIEQMILDAIVYREVLLVNRFNAGMAQMLYQFSHAPVLDYIAALVGVERLSEAKASCTVRFSLVDRHGGVVIPKGTRVSSSDGKAVFETTEDVIAAVGVSYVDIYVIAQQPGTAYNGYVPGSMEELEEPEIDGTESRKATINTLLDPYAFIEKVENLDVTGGGSDIETDEQLRERIKLAPSQFSSAGSRQSYLYHAKSANSMIKDVSVYRDKDKPGKVIIVPLIEDKASFEAVQADVEAACNDEKVRPLTDTVEVKEPQGVNYSIQVDVTLYEGASAKTIADELEATLKKYANEKRSLLGQDIIRSHISQVCRIADVYDIVVVSPEDNKVVGDHEYANLEKDVQVNIIGFSRG